MISMKSNAQEIRNTANKNNEFVEELKKTKLFDLEKTYIDYNPNTKEIVIPDGMENYINPITKEYFIMEKSMFRSSLAKHFTFSIRHSISSSAFYLSSNSISVYSRCTSNWQ